MRRAVLATGIVLAALASGCGGGSDRLGSRPNANSGSQGPAAAAIPQASDGRLGGAVVARPGTTDDKGGAAKITGRSILPPPVPGKHGVGAEENCTDVDVQPTASNLAHVSDVIFCLMNAMRANAGVPALRQQDLLARASVDHSQDMVTNKYFAHDALDGRDVVARLKEVPYIPKAGDWVIGENLAWGSGSLGTPKALVNAWMNSPPHRENLLSGDFQEVGMGLAFGTQLKDASDGLTVTTDFGTRPDLTQPVEATPSSDSGSPVMAKTSSRKKKALRRCARKHGKAKRRCVKAARRIHG